MVPGDVQEGGQENLPVPSLLRHLLLCQESLLLPHPHRLLPVPGGPCCSW